MHMRVHGPLETVRSSRLPPAATVARTVEKTSTASDLNGERQDAPLPRRNPATALRIELVCQDDTQAFDPFRDAPKLRPVFVAQVLGQVMDADRAAPSAQAAYRRTAEASGRLFDRRG